MAQDYVLYISHSATARQRRVEAINSEAG